ncbi:YhfC family intramembrane metalloprotease [Alkalihalobacillus sp. 1P02AB]|uniref:YhfC family intramembrane metalloprotease n=1 Tax=Alkalihalobacillus sp. 1P02AB TaxID=3132260 RepID=UPI0039A590F6
MVIGEGTIRLLTMSVYSAVLIPLILILVAKFKFKASIKVVLIGMLTFFVFSQLFVNIFHMIVFASEPMERFVHQTFIFVPYAAVTAALFAELGRYVMFTYLLKKYRDWSNGLGFGIGFGSFEAVLILGFTSVSMVTAAVMINEGIYEDPLIISQLMEVSNSFIVFGVIERLFSITLHIALSILIVYAIKTGLKKYLLYAILAHSIFNIPGMLYQAEVLSSVIVVEAILALFAVVAFMYIKKSRKIFVDTFGLADGNT